MEVTYYKQNRHLSCPNNLVTQLLLLGNWVTRLLGQGVYHDIA